jgi:hypothetical protein
MLGLQQNGPWIFSVYVFSIGEMLLYLSISHFTEMTLKMAKSGRKCPGEGPKNSKIPQVHSSVVIITVKYFKAPPHKGIETF